MISSVFCVCVSVRSREETEIPERKKTRGVIFLDVSFLSQKEVGKKMMIVVLICEWCGDEWTKWNKNNFVFARSDHFLLTYDSSERK